MLNKFVYCYPNLSATFADLHSGLLCFGSTRKPTAAGAKSQSSAPSTVPLSSFSSLHNVVTRAEISTLNLHAKLVVISGGWSRRNFVNRVETTRLMSLAASFLRAGEAPSFFYVFHRSMLVIFNIC